MAESAGENEGASVMGSDGAVSSYKCQGPPVAKIARGSPGSQSQDGSAAWGNWRIGIVDSQGVRNFKNPRPNSVFARNAS